MKAQLTVAFIALMTAIGLTLHNEAHDSNHFEFESIQNITMIESEETTTLNLQKGRWVGTHTKKSSQESKFFLTSYKFNAIIDAFSHLTPLRNLGLATPEKVARYNLDTTQDHINITNAEGHTYTLTLGRKGYGRSEQYILFQKKIWLVSRDSFKKIIHSHKKYPEEHIITGNLKNIKINHHDFIKENMLWLNDKQKPIDLKPLLKWHIASIQPQPPQHSLKDLIAQITTHNMDGHSQELLIYKSKHPSHVWVHSSNGYWIYSDIKPIQPFQNQAKSPVAITKSKKIESTPAKTSEF
ncbi:MAG: hypothetical protein AB8C84_00725 [Oligoflexales bacterium]